MLRNNYSLGETYFLVSNLIHGLTMFPLWSKIELYGFPVPLRVNMLKIVLQNNDLRRTLLQLKCYLRLFSNKRGIAFTQKFASRRPYYFIKIAILFNF